MTFYATGLKCANANAGFTPADVSSMKEAIKRTLDDFGTDQAERDNDWKLAEQASDSQTLTAKDCQQLRHDIVQIWPDAFPTQMLPNPF